MRRVTAVLSAAAIVLSTVGVFAQAKPDFSGKWTLVPAAGGGGGGGGGRGGGRGGANWGMNPTITHTATTLNVVYMGGGQAPAEMKLTFNIGGAPTKRQMAARGETVEVTDTAAWVGNSLVITTKTPTVEQKRTLTLKDGNLVMEFNSGREGATPTTLTYKKG
jgi:hypothetical protein